MVEVQQTYLFNVQSFLQDILDKEGWRKATREEKPSFSFLGARRPMPGRAPPLNAALSERAKKYSESHPKRPEAPLRMHDAPGLVKLNDKGTFWQQLHAHKLHHLQPHTILFEDCGMGGIREAMLSAPQMLHSSGLWFLKYRHGDNGRNVMCCASVEEVVDAMKKEAITMRPELYLVQAGVRPFLVDGRKAVLRFYVLVTQDSEYCIYAHKEFLLKILGAEYSEQLTDDKIHVDSTSGQIGLSVRRGSEWALYESLWPQMCSVAVQVFQAFQSVLEPNPDANGRRFSVTGLDFVVTLDGYPIVLEANSPPSLHEEIDPVAKAIKMEVCEDLYSMLIRSKERKASDCGFVLIT